MQKLQRRTLPTCYYGVLAVAWGFLNPPAMNAPPKSSTPAPAVLDLPPHVHEQRSGRWSTFLVCVVSNIFAGLSATLVASYLPDTLGELVGAADAATLGRVGAYVGSVLLIGWALGGVAFGWVGDRFGRARAFRMALALFGGTMLATAWTPSWHVLVVYRFLTGAGIGGTMVVSAILVAEVWPTRTRAVALAMLGVAFPVGIVSSGLLNYALPDWRAAFLIGMFPLVLAILALKLVGDPATWTVARSARQTAPIRHFGHLVGPENRKNLLIGAAVFGVMSVGLWAAFSWLPTWAQSIMAPDADGQKERGLLMMILGTAGIVGTALSGFVSNAIGRRKTLIVAFTGCFIASFILFKTNTLFSSIVFAETALLALFFGLGQGVLMVYIPELFPTLVRSTGTGICFNAGRVVTATAVFFVGILVPVLGGYGNAVFAFAFMYLLGIGVAWLGPETRGKVL